MTRSDARDLRKLARQARSIGELPLVLTVYLVALVFATATAVAVVVAP